MTDWKRWLGAECAGQDELQSAPMAPPAPQQLADTFVEKADAARSRGEDELAWGWLQKAMVLYRAEKDDRGIAAAGRRLASLLARRGDLRGALRQAEEARGAAELAWSRPDMASIDYVVGAIHCQLGEVELGLRWLHRSVDMWGELGRIGGQIRAWRRIAHAQSVDGDLGAGLAAWGRCLTVFRHQQDISGEADIHAEIAQACVRAGRPDLALTHVLAALGRHRHLQHAAQVTEDLGLMVDIQGQLGGDAYQESLQQHLDESAASLVSRLVEAEAERRAIPPSVPEPELGPSPELDVATPVSASPDAASRAPEEDWESVFWSRSDQGLEDEGVGMPDQRPLELVTVFGKLIVGMVGLLLLLLFTAILRALFSE